MFAAPADETYERARAALNEAEYKEAIKLYRDVYEREGESELAADALYWRAFAHYKLQEHSHLRQASELLAQQMSRFPESALLADAEALAARVDGQLARQGNARAKRRVIVEAHGREDQERETRVAALNALMMMDPDKAIPILKKILSDGDKDPELKRHALMVLTQVDDDEAEQILLEVVANETDPEMVVQSLFWLSRIGSDAAFDAVVKAYRGTDDEEVKQAALMAIGESDDRRAVDLLLEIVGDEDAGDEVRHHALFALSRSGADNLAEVFVDLYDKSDNTEFKSMIMFSMSQLDEPAPAEWFAKVINDRSESAEVRQHALHHASMMDLVDVDFLRSVYDADDDPEMRTQVCFALSQIDDPEAVDLAIEIVRKETDPDVRHNAVFWLGQFDDPKVVDFLIELIEED
ncbi:HEAT repeat domain-containing protein [bacterium]|nr:HEAT repeat domain-containing protein [bacterium]